MITHDIRKRLEDIITHILFDYNGKECGIDPLSRTRYDMWYGDELYTAKSIDEVMSVKFFGGKSLTEIAEDIKNLE